ncbi:MAG: hypothetical protein QOF09_2688 [Alphaproteobacteria bacterium]|nr:hypothetical protein [Alphaproteobacteria bacterium]
MRFLIRLGNRSKSDLRPDRSLGADVPVFSLQSVWRIARPDRENLVDRFDEHRVTVLIEHAHRLSIGPMNARADAHDEAALQNMVEHRYVRCHYHWMAMRQVDDTSSEFHLLGNVRQRCEE